ncbi:MAG: pilus assembly protein CpaB [Kiritimatiellia bacterium]|jgi:pilus assembly protein CpaB
MGSTGGSRRVAILFLGLSVVAAGLATLILMVVFNQLQSRLEIKQKTHAEELVSVVIAVRTLEQGTTIKTDDLVVKQIPRPYYLEQMFDDSNIILGRVPRERILEGEPLRAERLADPKAGAGLNALIPKGQRALQIELHGGQAVAGFINPGDYVDLIYTAMDQKLNGTHTTTLLQSKQVLAVDDRLAVNDEAMGQRGHVAPSVTLALTPEQAQKVTHANRTGNLTLTLRNHVDVTHQEIHGVVADSFIGSKNGRRPVAQPVKAPARTGTGPVIVPVATPAGQGVTIIQGGDRTEVKDPKIEGQQ